LERFAQDVVSFGIARDTLERAADFARSKQDILKPEPTLALIPREKKLIIWTTWSSILDAQAALDAIRRSWHGQIVTKKSESRNLAFSMSHAAFLASYRYGLELVALADSNPDLDIILNEAVPELGIPRGTFDRYKARYLNVALATEFSALRTLDRVFVKTSPVLKASIAEDSARIWKMGKGTGPVLTAKEAADVLRRTGFSAWFPVQKNVSEWMGDTKVRRRHSHLISEEQMTEARSRLQPGDIFFERHEWYLSNLGLPGFWTHAAYYVGTPEERRAYFSEAKVQAWVSSQGVPDGDFEKLLKTRYPAAYAISVTPQEEGHVPRVLEAISEGVAFTTLERTGASDSLAVIRPRLDPREKALAILRAFHYSGRPYDFNFDFATDATLVCSELIYKAYEPGGGMRGIRFPLTEVMGRKVSTPNNMVRQFDETADTEMAQTDFVLFLDGVEKERRAVESTREQFRLSWKRPNWHILIQAPPQEEAMGIPGSSTEP
jgi:uncharacterized protein YycO